MLVSLNKLQRVYFGGALVASCQFNDLLKSGVIREECHMRMKSKDFCGLLKCGFQKQKKN